MIYQVKLAELQQAAALIRANPEMDRETFYQTITAANPQGLTQEQIEQAIQTVTQALVDLNFVETNHFDDIAPWLRALPETQVPFMLDAIHKQYLKSIRQLLTEERIDLLNTVNTDLDEKIDFGNLKSSELLSIGGDENSKIADLISKGVLYYMNLKDANDRAITRLEKELGI